MAEHVKISVVMPLGPDLEDLDEQIRALASQRSVGEFELLLSYNHPDAIAPGPRALPPGLIARHLDTSDTPGAAWACNRAIAAATGDLVLICHSDDVVAPDWVANLSSALLRHPVVGGVCEESSLNEDIKHWRSAGPVSTELGTVDPLLPKIFCGANCGFHRQLFAKLGGFDPRVAPCDDVAFTFALTGAAIPIVVEPKALISYRHRRTYEGFERQYRSYGRGTTLSVAAYQHVGLRITAAQYVARVAHWLAHSPQARQNPWIRRRTERYLEGCHETLEVIQRDGIAPLPRSVFTEAIR